MLFSLNSFTNGTSKIIKQDPLTKYSGFFDIAYAYLIFGHPGTSGPDLPIKLSHVGVHSLERASQITQKNSTNRQYR